MEMTLMEHGLKRVKGRRVYTRFLLIPCEAGLTSPLAAQVGAPGSE